MGDKYNVFISWSGQRSKWAAEALRDWLPLVLQAARPWMSEADIDKGSRGLDEVGRALEGMKIGIICLTPENLDARWILYEAGALSKTLDAKTRLCTYLLAGLQFQNVQAPLGMFQATKAEKEETRKLVHTINKALDGEPVPEQNLDAVFDGMWPRLEQKLTALPEVEQVVEAGRSSEEMLAEILEISRAEANRRRKTDRLDQYLPLMDELMPLLAEGLKAARNAPAHSPRAAADILSGRTEARKLFCVKLEYDDEVKKIEGTAAVEDFPGRLIVYDAGRPTARFADKVQNWWVEAPPEARGGFSSIGPQPLEPPPE